MLRLLTCFIFLLPLTLYSQETPAPVSEELAALINVPVLVNDAGPGGHSGNTLHFDKRILIHSSSSAGASETYLYINTRNGDIAVRTGKRGTLGTGDIDINDEAFTLTYYNPMGMTTAFYNNKKRGELVHYRSTLNTEISSLTMPAFISTSLSKTGESRAMLPRHFTVTPYKAESAGAPTVYICGGSTPAGLMAQKFIGFSGIGYLKTDRGIYMITEMRSGAHVFTAVKWEQVNINLDFSAFLSAEAEMYDDAERGIRSETEMLESKEFSGDCAEYAAHVNELEKQQAIEMREQARSSRAGNFVTDSSSLVTLAGIGDPEKMLEIMSARIELSYCKADKITDPGKRQEKMTCIAAGRQALIRASLEVQEAARRYAGDQLKAAIEKRKAFMLAARSIPECNR